MARAERLFELMQCLRRHREPVSGQALAQETGVSLRTLYRDIASLRAQGAGIEGEAGVGFVLRPGYLLPPMTFSPQELEALMLGVRWVGRRGDAQLGAAAHEAMTRIAAVLPAALRHELESTALMVGPPDAAAADDAIVAQLRDAIRRERKLHIRYRDLRHALSERVIWPFGLGFFEQSRVVVAWCEQREDFRHFRTDRILLCNDTGLRYPRRRQALLREWKTREQAP